MSTKNILSVAVPRPLPQTFNYLSPEPVPIGARVKIPFAGQKLIGLVVGKNNTYEKKHLKSIINVIDRKPLISNDLLALLKFTARYYHYPIGEVIQSALPKLLRTGESVKRELPRRWQITEQGRAALMGKLGDKQQAVLKILMEKSWWEADLRAQVNVSPAWLTELSARDWISSCNQWHGVMAKPAPAPLLNSEQENALQQLPRTGFAVSLLDGVTGAGKTEIYLRWIEKLTANGGQILFLVPEIGLVQILAQRLAARLGDAIGIYHSELPDRLRLETWLAARAGDVRVLVGTRSAIFAPFADLRAIVIDEEHDAAYKQQEKLRYHARDLAVFRGQQEKIPVLLGSATPSLESYHHVWTGKWQRLALTRRATDVLMPKVHIENMDGALHLGGLSVALIRTMRRVLHDGGQVMLFLNRRGFAPLLRCKNCHWISRCPRCKKRLTVHEHFMQCHDCRKREKFPSVCPKCQSDKLQKIGQGTQRLEQTVRQQFPNARILRIDTDAFTTQKQFSQAVEQVHAGNIDIVLGTQWLSKGHHFPNLHLVAVVDADGALFSSDFRAEERLAQLLLQVGGRAGRELQGEIWVQTAQPSHPIFNVFSTPYQQTAKRIYSERKTAGLPPIGAQVLLFASDPDPQKAWQTLEFTREGAKNAGVGKEWLWLLAPLAHKNGLPQVGLLIQAENKSTLQKELPQLMAWLFAQSKAFKVRVGIDVDPVENL